MTDTRIMKALRDLWSDKARTLIVIAAIAIGIFSVGTVLVGFAILDREMNANYMNTNPASAILYIGNPDARLLSAVQSDPAIRDAELRRMVTARVQTGPDQWQNAQLFVLDDFNDVRISAMHPEAGSWPAGKDEILFERVALPLTGKSIGDTVTVKLPDGVARELRIAGTAHDPGLAPANMEGIAYGYVSRETLQDLGGSANLNQLLIVVADNGTDEPAIKATTYGLKSRLEQNGYTVNRIEVPHPGQHPHASQMRSLMFLFEAFGVLSLLLSLLLVFNMITGLLAGQVRQVGSMKALGATTGQIMAIYLGSVLILGAVATAIALPLSVLAGEGLAALVAAMLNFDIFSNAIPWWVFAVVIGAGLLLPALSAVYPIYRGSRITVREAINDYGISETARAGIFSGLSGRLPLVSRPLLLSIRNTFRRRERLALTLLTLGIGGALFIVAMSLNTSMDTTVDNALDTRHFNDIVVLGSYYPAQALAANVSGIPGVTRVECIDNTAATLTYKDGGDSNQFAIFAVQPASEMISYPILEGRWLQPGDQSSIVLNHALAKELADQGNGTPIKAGDTVTLNLKGQRSDWHVVGIAREMMAPPRAYVSYDYYSGVAGLNGLANAVVVSTADRNATPAPAPGGITIHGMTFSMSHGQQPASAHDNSRAIMPGIERSLKGAGMNVSTVSSIGDMRQRLKEHLAVIVAFVMCMAAMAVAVGVLGLASSMSINVLERRRELGIMRAIGATPRSISGIVLAEGLLIGLLSWVIAVLIAAPVSAVIGTVFGTIFFNSPLDLAISHPGMLLWLAIIVVLSPLASLLSARNASKLPVHEVLAYE